MRRLESLRFKISDLIQFSDLKASMASAIHGVPRSTWDVDFVVELKEEQVDDLVAAPESEFNIDHWAAELGVDDLLIRGFNDAGVPSTSAR
jgi:hypothetical protein